MMIVPASLRSDHRMLCVGIRGGFRSKSVAAFVGIRTWLTSIFSSLPKCAALLLVFCLRPIRPHLACDRDRHRSFFLNRDVSFLPGFGGRGGGYVFRV